MKSDSPAERYAFLGLLVLFFILGLWQGCRVKQHEIDTLTTENALLKSIKDDTLVSYRNKLGQEVSMTHELTGDLESFKKMSFKKDSTISKLQKLLTKKTSTATIVSNETSGTVNTVTTVIHDTIRLGHDSATCEVKYKSHFENRWERFDIVASRDSIRMKYKVFNEFDITQQNSTEGKWPHRKTVSTIQIVNLNPNTQTKELKSFTVSMPKTNKLRIFGAGVGAGAVMTGIIIYELKTMFHAN